MANWKSQGLGIEVVTLLLDDPNGGKPNVQGCKTWIDNFSLKSIYVMADPTFSMVPGSSVGTPQQSVVDPRTMKVVYLQEGYSGQFPQLEQLANQNK